MRECKSLKAVLIIAFILVNFLSFSSATASTGGDLLADIIAGVGANETTLRISTQQNITENLTIPSNVTLRFAQGGSLNISTTKTVTINGHVEADLYQIFEWAGTGKVVFGANVIKEVYPQWWGAEGDGTTDDVVAIQAAADALSSGGLLFLPTGTYLVTGNGTECINIQYSIKVKGASLKDTIIKLVDSQTVAAVLRTKAANNLDFVQFENFTIDGNKGNQTGVQNQNGLYLDNVQDGIVRNVHVHDVYSDDPPTTEAGGINVVDSFDVLLDSCTVKAIDGYGIYFGNAALQFIRGTINNCYATECVSVGINAWQVRNLIVTGSHAFANTNSGFMFEDCYNVSMGGGCSAYLNGGIGIWINETSDSIVSGCLSYNNDSHGIAVYGTDGYPSNDNIIIGNRCEDERGAPSQDYGIYEGAFADRNLIVGNNIKGNVNNPIFLSGSDSKCYHNITDESVDIASAGTITLPNTGEYFNITGTVNITAVTASWVGRRVVLKFAAILTFTDGGNLKLAGNFVTSADDTIAIVSDGTSWFEESRSVN